MSPAIHLSLVLAVATFTLAATTAFCDPPSSQPARQGDTFALLNVPGSDTRIDYASLPALKGTHGVISASDGKWKFQLHNYLIRFDDRFFCMWSRGPGEDQPTQYIAWASSADGINWSGMKTLVGPPEEGYAYIARGFWVRNGELIALVAHFHGQGAFGVNKELKLEAFVYDKPSDTWKYRREVFDNAINNFPPEILGTGDWMMSRRDARFNVSMLIGGVKALDDWRVVPIIEIRKSGKFRPDEPIWWVNPDKTIIGLFRDNGGSSRLFRNVSTDNGNTWSEPQLTNFPNATSKLFSMATAGGYRLLISNANPAAGRRELYLSGSDDGVVFNRMSRLAIPSPKPATLQYPHAIEYDGSVWIAFSRNKTAIEIFKVPLQEIDSMRGK